MSHLKRYSRDFVKEKDFHQNSWELAKTISIAAVLHAYDDPAMKTKLQKAETVHQICERQGHDTTLATIFTVKARPTR